MTDGAGAMPIGRRVAFIESGSEGTLRFLRKGGFTLLGSPRAVEHPVEDREHEQREQRGTDDAADDDGRERALDFRAGAGGDGHRDEAE